MATWSIFGIALLVSMMVVLCPCEQHLCYLNLMQCNHVLTQNHHSMPGRRHCRVSPMTHPLRLWTQYKRPLWQKKRILVCILKFLCYQANIWQNFPFLHWRQEQSSYLDEMIHLEGCSDEITQETCNCKGEEPSLYHCQDCFRAEIVCHACIL